MKTLKIFWFITFTLCFSSFALFAQKNNVKSAERIIKSDKANYNEARELIKQALSNPETKNEVKTVYVAGLIEEQNFTFENVKQLQEGATPDKKIMNNALLDMYKFYMDAYKKEHEPDSKGRIKNHYTKKILESFETNHLYFINAGGYFMEQKDFSRALEAFDYFKSIKKIPEFAGKPIAQADSNSMMVDFFSVVAAYQSGDKENAVKVAKTIKNVPYRQNDLIQILSQAQIEQGDTIGYIETMKEGLDLFPNEPYYSVNLINTYISIGMVDNAITTIKSAIEKSPNNPQYYNVLGKLYESSNEEEAVKCFQKSIEVDPNFMDSYYDLGRVYYNQAVTLKSGEKIDPATDKKAKELFMKALPLLQKAYEKNPQQVYYVLGNVYYNLGMNKEYEKIMKENGAL